MDRQAIGVHHRINLAGQAASRASYGVSSIPSDSGTVLVRAHAGGIDHLHGCVVGPGKSAHYLGPDARASPTKENDCSRSCTDRSCLAGRGHGAPDRNTQKIPLRTRRSFTRGTRGLFGSIGLIAAHSLSVIS
jgi:hypothetical protein